MDYIRELIMKTIVVTYGRFQPPTRAHGELFWAMQTEADKIWNCPVSIFISPKQDHKNNPLSFQARQDYLWKCGLTISRGVNPVNNPFLAVCQLGDAGYERVIFYCGSDQLKKYETWKQYINHKDPKKRIPGVQELIFRQFGLPRGPVNDMNATQAREAAKAGDFETFNSIVLGTNLEQNRSLYLDTVSGLLDK